MESDGEDGISHLRGKERVVSKVTCLRCGLCMSASCEVVGEVWIWAAGSGCVCRSVVEGCVGRSLGRVVVLGA